MKTFTWTGVAGFCLTIALLRPAHAVMLEPTTDIAELQTGDLVSFNLLFEPDTPILGGGFDIVFDELALGLAGFTRNPDIGDPLLSRDPDILPGVLESWAIGDFAGLFGTLFLGSVDFRVLETMNALSTVSLRTTQGIAGPFISAVDFVTVVEPDYNSIELSRAADDPPTPVPEPGTLALFLLALAMLSAAEFRRQREPACRAQGPATVTEVATRRATRVADPFSPARPRPPHIHVHERAVRRGAPVDTQAADIGAERAVVRQAVDEARQPGRVGAVDPAVTGQVIHAAVGR